MLVNALHKLMLLAIVLAHPLAYLVPVGLFVLSMVLAYLVPVGLSVLALVLTSLIPVGLSVLAHDTYPIFLCFKGVCVSS